MKHHDAKAGLCYILQMNTPADHHHLLAGYSTGDITAMDVRRALDGITYGDLLILMAEANLPMPRTPTAGREAQLEKARSWLFPKQDRAA